MDADARKALQSRFEQEFRSAGTLSHPSVVTIYDVGQEGGLTYIAMELVEGTSLQRVLESGQVPSIEQILTIAEHLAEALDHAHGSDIVHRDIKPANVLFTREGRAKITDFGVAKFRSLDLTMTGTLVGTPGYMSPEQVLGRKVTGASDQFSLAVMIYQMMTGHLPFEAPEAATILYRIAHEEPPVPHELNTSMSREASTVLLKALSKDPDDRYRPAASSPANCGGRLAGTRLDSCRWGSTATRWRLRAALTVWDRTSSCTGRSIRALATPMTERRAGGSDNPPVAVWAYCSFCSELWQPRPGIRSLT